MVFHNIAIWCYQVHFRMKQFLVLILQINSFFSHFGLFQNGILLKVLNSGFWNFQPIFFRMYFLLIETFFSQPMVICVSWYLNVKHVLWCFNIYHLTFADKTVRVLGLYNWKLNTSYQKLWQQNWFSKFLTGY